MEGDQLVVAQHRVFRKRWFVLLIFCCLSASNNVQWIIFSPIVRHVQQYFKCSATAVNWLPLIYNLVYIIAVFPICAVYEQLGLRKGMLIGGLVNLIGASLKVLAVYGIRDYWVLAVSQLFSGMGQVFVLSLPPMVSATWFSERERTFATACASNASNLGIAIGFLVCPALVDSASQAQLGWLFGHQAVVCAVILALIYGVVDAKPPVAPSVTANTHDEPAAVIPTLRVLLANAPFVLLSIAIGAGQSVFGGVCAVLVQVLQPFGVSEVDAGWIGFIGVFTGIVCCFGVSMAIDRVRRYKLPLVLIFGGALLCQVLLVVMLKFDTSKATVSSFSLLIACQTLQALTYPLAFEFAAELSYPCPESVSGGVVMWVNNLLTFAVTLAMSLVLGNSPTSGEAIWAWGICIAVTATSCGLCLGVKEGRRRVELESARKAGVEILAEDAGGRL